MSWSPNFIEDGETPGVSNINTLFTGFRTYVNSLDRSALRLGALNVDQTPSIIKSGEPSVVEHNATDTHSYTDAIFGASIRYTTHGANGGTSTAGLYTGDRLIIGHPDQTNTAAAPAARITLNGGTGYLVGNNGTDKVSFILVMFNVDVVQIIDGSSECDAMVCLQFKHSGSGTWFTLPKTERFVSKNDHKHSPTDTLERVWVDVPIRTIIGVDQMTAVGGDPAVDEVVGVRAMCSLKDGSAAAILYLGSYRLTAIPMLAQVT